MATRYSFGIAGAESSLGDVPLWDRIQGRPLLAAPDGSASTQWLWTFIAPPGMVPPYSLVFHGFASVAAGDLYLITFVEAVTPGDALNLNTSHGYGAGDSAVVTCPGTAGYEFTLTITLTNDDDLADGDLVRLEVDRHPTNAADTLAGTYYLLGAELLDSA